MRRLYLFIFFFALAITTYSQDKPVKWYTIQEAEKLSKQSFRPIFIDTYTDWCIWCKRMDQDTFSNSVIADILNKSFYPVKFNAEGKESVDFFGQTFINDGKAGNAHQLAVALLNGKLSYPTVVVLTKQENKLQIWPIVGFRPAKEMEVLLSYFADKANESQKLEDYMANFKGKIQ